MREAEDVSAGGARKSLSRAAFSLSSGSAVVGDGTGCAATSVAGGKALGLLRSMPRFSDRSRLSEDLVWPRLWQRKTFRQAWIRNIPPSGTRRESAGAGEFWAGGDSWYFPSTASTASWPRVCCWFRER